MQVRMYECTISVGIGWIIKPTGNIKHLNLFLLLQSSKPVNNLNVVVK